MKHTRVVSTKCTPGFACRAFSDTTLVCFIVNEHTTKCSRYSNTRPHKSHWHDSDWPTSLISYVWVLCIYIKVTRSMLGSNWTGFQRLKDLLALHKNRRGSDTVANLTFLVLKLELYRGNRSLSWLLMIWLLASPNHQQTWYWLCRINEPLPMASLYGKIMVQISFVIPHKYSAHNVVKSATSSSVPVAFSPTGGLCLRHGCGRRPLYL